MTDPPGGRDDEALDVHIVETTPVAEAHGDVIPGRTRRPPYRWSLRPAWLGAMLAVALAAGIGIGYLIGRPDHHRAAAAPTTPLPAGSALAEIPQQLSSPQNFCVGSLPGSRLMLGAELNNDIPRTLVLRQLRGVFPLGGLRVVGTQVGQCDNNSTEPVAGHRVEPSAEVWLTLIVEVTGTSCPAPLPVHFGLDYTIDGTPHTQTLAGFPDLSGVPFPGCPSPS